MEQAKKKRLRTIQLYTEKETNGHFLFCWYFEIGKKYLVAGFQSLRIFFSILTKTEERFYFFLLSAF